jgi:microcystin-dependent protein
MRIAKYLTALAGAATILSMSAPAQAQDFYLGQIIQVGFNYCPANTAEANGAIIPIQSSTALFSLFGTMYGGDGQTTFALPDLRGRSAIGAGQGPGLQNYAQGQNGGAETATMSTQQMPPHVHSGHIRATNGPANLDDPTGAVLADFPTGTPVYNNQVAPNVDMAANTVMTDPAGGGQPMDIRSPYLTLRSCVIVEGIFPPRPNSLGSTRRSSRKATSRRQ